MTNDPNYNPLGQERYDELARQMTKARGEQGPQGATVTPSGAITVKQGMFSATPTPGGSLELTRYTFAPGELDPDTDMIGMQIWPSSTAPDAGGVWELVGVLWNSTGLFTMPANDVSGYAWYAYMVQFSNPSNSDTLLIDPGYTPGMPVRPTGPQYNSIAIASDWMSKGGSLVFQATNITGSINIDIRAIIKVWTIKP